MLGLDYKIKHLIVDEENTIYEIREIANEVWANKLHLIVIARELRRPGAIKRFHTNQIRPLFIRRGDKVFIPEHAPYKYVTDVCWSEPDQSVVALLSREIAIGAFLKFSLTFCAENVTFLI
jgi:hypothetical protein